MSKKIKLTRLIQFVNEFNRTSDCDSLIREGYNMLLEEALKDSDVYDGYNHIWNPLGKSDNTRRNYNTHDDLL